MWRRRGALSPRQRGALRALSHANLKSVLAEGYNARLILCLTHPNKAFESSF